MIRLTTRIACLTVISLCSCTHREERTLEQFVQNARPWQAETSPELKDGAFLRYQNATNRHEKLMAGLSALAILQHEPQNIDFTRKGYKISQATWTNLLGSSHLKDEINVRQQRTASPPLQQDVRLRN